MESKGVETRSPKVRTIRRPPVPPLATTRQLPTPIGKPQQQTVQPTPETYRANKAVTFSPVLPAQIKTGQPRRTVGDYRPAGVTRSPISRPSIPPTVNARTAQSPAPAVAARSPNATQAVIPSTVTANPRSSVPPAIIASRSTPDAAAPARVDGGRRILDRTVASILPSNRSVPAIPATVRTGERGFPTPATVQPSSTAPSIRTAEISPTPSSREIRAAVPPAVRPSAPALPAAISTTSQPIKRPAELPRPVRTDRTAPPVPTVTPTAQSVHSVPSVAATALSPRSPAGVEAKASDWKPKPPRTVRPLTVSRL